MSDKVSAKPIVISMPEGWEKGKDMGKKKDKDKDKNRKRILIIFLAVLVVLASVVLMRQFGLFTFPWEKVPTQVVVAGDLFPGQGGASSGHLPNMTPDQIKAQMQKVADESQFSFKINSRPIFENGSAQGDLGIENPSYNVYPMVVQIFLEDTDEIIYDSGGILPNQHIYTARLLRPLSAGEYRAIAVLNAYDPDTLVWQGKAQAALIITVLN